MITYYDKYTQVIVSQTLASESQAYEKAKADPYGEVEPSKFLQSIINWKTNITHVDYNVMVSPRDVNENGVTNDISWGTNHYEFLSDGQPVTSNVDDDAFIHNHAGGIHFDMIGGFVNSSHTDVPNWGSHS